MTVRIATQNIHWPNKQTQKRIDILRSAPDADVICFQEVYRTPILKFLGSPWDALDSNKVGRRDIAMAWRTNVLSVINEDFYVIGKMKKGSKKTFAIAWIETENAIYASVHPPHGKYERENPGIKEECYEGIIDWFNAQVKPVVLGGDWNYDIKKDSFNIAGKTGAVFVGGGRRGIDGFLVSPEFSTLNVFETEVNSDHPVVYITASLNTAPIEEPVLTRGKNFDEIERILEKAIKNNLNRPKRLKALRKMRRALRTIKPHKKK